MSLSRKAKVVMLLSASAGCFLLGLVLGDYRVVAATELVTFTVFALAMGVNG